MARYPNAIWRGPVPNQGGAMGPVNFGVMHIMEGTLAGTDSWFHDPGAQVSAHFGVGKDGTIYQWVDTDVVAWAEAGFNDQAISIEHEGNSGDALTSAQIASDVGLVRWLRDTKLLPIQRSTVSPTTRVRGWVGHGELGVAGGNHPDCPGQPILDQMPLVLVLPGLAPDPIPLPQGEPQMFANDPVTGGVWATDEKGELFALLGAPFIQGLNQHPDLGAGNWLDPCVGIAYWGRPATGDGIVYFTRPANGVGGIKGTPYSAYRWLRNGHPA